MKKIFLGLMSCVFLMSCGVFKSKSSDQNCPANVNIADKLVNQRSISRGADQSCPANVNTTENNTKTHKSCPPAAFGAEKLLSYADRDEQLNHPTEKGDPITGKKTSVKKGIRTGELDKPVKLTSAERKQKRIDDRKKKAEDRALEAQIERDAKLARKEPAPY